ncbi:unnamed protein product, partial [Anisakis simplex]|uniref:Craniofacial development protein 2-like n=1 Tax=Anisakis simplex TaxID=6269 RepID=A0A0M3J0D8_ANISI
MTLRIRVLGPTWLKRNGKTAAIGYKGWQPETAKTVAKKPINQKNGQDSKKLENGPDGQRFKSNGRVKPTNNAQPTEEAEEDLEEFFEEAERAMNKKSTYTIVQGDFNAKVGCRINQNERYIDYEDLVKKINEAAKEASEKAPSRRTMRIQNHTKQLMADRARRIIEGKTNEEEYKSLCKEIRRCIKADCEAYRTERLRKVVEAHKSVKKAERDVALKRKMPNALKDNSGRTTSVRSEIKEICEKFYNDLYSSKIQITEKKSRAQEEEIPTVMKEEVKNALSKMKTDKSPGNDKIKAEYLKMGGENLHKALAERFTKYLQNTEIPKIWLTSETVLIRKKGDPEDLANYRPITLLSQ